MYVLQFIPILTNASVNLQNVGWIGTFGEKFLGKNVFFVYTALEFETVSPSFSKTTHKR